MNRFSLTTLYRSLTRHKLYAVLNIGGLAIGIAVFLVLGLYVRFETGYETWLPGYRHLYVVEENWNQPGAPANGTSSGTMGGLLDELRADFPDTVGTRIRTFGADVMHGGVATEEKLAQADPDFLKLVPLTPVAGDPVAALADPAGLVLTSTMADKYFPAGDALGQTLTLNVMGKQGVYQVKGIVADLPKATEFDFTMLGRIPTKPDDEYWSHWGSERVETILRFASPAEARAYADRLPAFIRRRGAKDLGDLLPIFSFKLTGIADLHFQTPGRKLMTTTLGSVGLLTLLIAIVNYVNLATARAGLRAREVAMRKVLGASRAALIRQFLGEAVLMVALAAVIGLALAELGLPFVNATGGLSLGIPYGLAVPALALLAATVGVLAGLYPALLLARFPAATVLASARAPGGGRAGTRVREALVVVQFALATAFIVGTMILFAQTRHVRNVDPGFRRDGLILVPSLSDQAVGDDQRTAFLARLRALPWVRSVVVSDAVPGYDNMNSNSVAIPGVASDGPSLQWIQLGPGFFQTYGVRLLAGRYFDARHRMDAFSGHWATPVNIIVNARAKTLGFASPQAAIGRTIGGASPRTIIGVVEDARFFSPRDPINPTVYYHVEHFSDDFAPIASIRVDGDPHARLPAIEALWRLIAPQVPFDGKTAMQNMEDYYSADDHTARLFAIGAGLAVLIGCIGLWGLASFNAARRWKEIGIRKTLGASSRDIAALLIGQFLRPVLLANLVAWPLAFVAMRAWLAGFDDRIALSPVYFVAASGVAILIAALTVLAQTLRAARVPPAWALRHE